MVGGRLVEGVRWQRASASDFVSALVTLLESPLPSGSEAAKSGFVQSFVPAYPLVELGYSPARSGTVAEVSPFTYRVMGNCGSAPYFAFIWTWRRLRFEAQSVELTSAALRLGG